MVGGMKVFLNGQLVDEADAVISVLDRGFLYGDGLFETLRVREGRPFRWARHWARLAAGAAFLRMELPFASAALLRAASELISANALADAVLRLTVSRGVGPRGYSPKGAGPLTVVMTLHALPAAPNAGLSNWRLITSSFRLPANEPLAQFKTCNKLPQILARAEADAAGADEALLGNTDGCLVEGASSNLFWIRDQQVCTPSLAGGILPGVTREAVLELCASLRIPVCQTDIRGGDLRRVDGVFVSLSTLGIVPAESLDGGLLNQSPLTRTLGAAYDRLLANECQG